MFSGFSDLQYQSFYLLHFTLQVTPSFESNYFLQVDTHIHASSAMNQKHLLRFIKKKVKAHGDDVVNMVDGKPVTLSDVSPKLFVFIRKPANSPNYCGNFIFS